VLNVVETCMSHIKKVANAKNSKKAVFPMSQNLDVEILNEVLVQLTKLRTRLKNRFKSPKEKCLTCILCCGAGGCFDMAKIKKRRQQKKAKKAKHYKTDVKDKSS
jgi:hypothetical protein